MGGVPYLDRGEEAGGPQSRPRFLARFRACDRHPGSAEIR